MCKRDTDLRMQELLNAEVRPIMPLHAQQLLPWRKKAVTELELEKYQQQNGGRSMFQKEIFYWAKQLEIISRHQQ